MAVVGHTCHLPNRLAGHQLDHFDCSFVLNDSFTYCVPKDITTVSGNRSCCSVISSLRYACD